MYKKVLEAAMQEHTRSMSECQIELSEVVKQDSTLTLEVAEREDSSKGEEQKFVPKSICRLTRKKAFNCRIDLSGCAK